MPERLLVDTAEKLEHALESLRSGQGPIAVDAERASGYRYSQRAYLIQLYRRGTDTILLDPPALGELAALNRLIAEEEWVLHAASQDLECLREAGLHPTTIFDTELAARLLNFPKVGLGTMVEELLGIHLAKQHSAADWSTRPLPESWLEYAALDVELLVDLRDEVERLLAEAGKQQIARQEFQAELDAPGAPPRTEPWRRLSKIHTLKDRRKLATARALWYARDELARSRDVSPGRLVPDRALVAAAQSQPSSRRDLAGLKEFTGRASRSHLTVWWRAVEQARAETELPTLRQQTNELPPARAWKDKKPEAAVRLTAAKDAVAALADELDVPAENLLKPRLVRQLAWDPPSHDVEALRAALAELGARPWQCDATAPRLHDAFVDADQTLSAEAASPSS